MQSYCHRSLLLLINTVAAISKGIKGAREFSLFIIPGKARLWGHKDPPNYARMRERLPLSAAADAGAALAIITTVTAAADAAAALNSTIPQMMARFVRVIFLSIGGAELACCDKRT